MTISELITEAIDYLDIEMAKERISSWSVRSKPDVLVIRCEKGEAGSQTILGRPLAPFGFNILLKEAQVIVAGLNKP